MATGLHLAVKTVEAHIRSTCAEFDLVPDEFDLVPDDREHRRVPAVLAFLRS